jgi:mannitol-specific phosphotransferase system IIBC component
VLAGVIVAAVVSFLVNSFLLKLTVKEDEYVEKEVARAETAPATA